MDPKRVGRALGGTQSYSSPAIPRRRTSRSCDLPRKRASDCTLPPRCGRGVGKEARESNSNGGSAVTMLQPLKLVAVPALPTPQEGFIDRGAFGCDVNAVRLNINCGEQLYLSCVACRAFLTHDLGDGWIIKETSREDIARQREDARERYAPQIGAVWEALRKMRKVA